MSDDCARDPYFYVPAETQSYVITFLLKESPCRQRGLNSKPLGYNGPESVTLATAPARHTKWRAKKIKIGETNTKNAMIIKKNFFSLYSSEEITNPVSKM